MNNSSLLYSGLLALAVFEAFTPTAYLIPGTLGVAAAGGFVQAGKLNAPLTLSVVWLGILIGDVASFLLARKFGDVLRRWKSVAAVLGRAESRLQNHPVAFMLLSRLSPFLKNAAAPAAGLIGWPLRRFLALEIVAALIDASWFLAIGYVVSASVGSVTEIPIAARIVGVIALLAVVGFFIGRGRKCRLPRTSPLAFPNAKRSFGFMLKCLLLVGPWELGGRLAKRAGFYDKPQYRGALARAVELAQPGDVVLVGRTINAPWGCFSHAMLVVSTPVGKALLHAYETGVQLTPVKAAPMCGKLAVVRIECSREQREALVNAAWSQLATPFKLGSRKPGKDAPLALNCIGLVAWAAAQAGVTVGDVPVGGVLVPDDVVATANARIIFEWMDGDGLEQPTAPTPVAPGPLKSLSPADTVVALSESADAAKAIAVTMIRSELFLGQARHAGQPISDEEVSAFVDKEVVPRFPAGTTQIAASGTYGSRFGGVIHERSRLLTILHPVDPVSKAMVHDVAELYRSRFQQEAVLVTMAPALVFGT
jgi:membrane protein DedA with SNARE-associated domain